VKKTNRFRRMLVQFRLGFLMEPYDGFSAALKGACAAPGPRLSEMALQTGSTPPGVGRPTLTPRQVFERFRVAVGEAG
jgi:hypothetical protein